MNDPFGPITYRFGTLTDEDYGIPCTICSTESPSDADIKYLMHCGDTNCNCQQICRSCVKQLARFFDLHRTEIQTL